MNKNLFSYYTNTFQPDTTGYTFKSPCDHCYIKTVAQAATISNGLPGDLYLHLESSPHYMNPIDIAQLFKRLGLERTLPWVLESRTELYTPYISNERYWQPDDLVIHTADAKTAQMLMRVIGYNQNTGYCRTTYIEDDYKFHPTVYENELRYLLDPVAFEHGEHWLRKFQERY